MNGLLSRLLIPFVLFSGTAWSALPETDKHQNWLSPYLNAEPQIEIAEQWRIPDGFFNPALHKSLNQGFLLSGLVSLGKNQALHFKPLNLYGPKSQLIHVSDQGSARLAASKRQFFIAQHGSVAASLIIESDQTVKGLLAENGRVYELIQNGHFLQTKRLSNEDREFESQCQTQHDDQPIEVIHRIKSLKMPSLKSHKGLNGPDYAATIAIDTDNEIMLDKFSNNTATALTWIEDLFTAMNVFYHRDLSLHLQIGDVFLRTGSDPFTNDGTANGDTGDDLTAVAEFWRTQMAHIDRDFVIFLSGKISSNSFSGIAWIDAYCQNGFVQGNGTTYGSISFNAVGSVSGISANWASTLIGHELGHNLGSVHTHCYTPAIDNCFNGEGGCYSGSTACPAGGGTIMSYCHLLGGCGNNAEFHPTVINLIDNRIIQNYPACISDYAVEEISFADSFEGSP